LEPVPLPGPLPVRLRVVVSFIVPGPVPGVPVLGVVVAPVDGLVLLVPGVPGPAVPVPDAAVPAFPVALPFMEPPVIAPPLIAPVSVAVAPGAGATFPPLVPIVVSVLFSFLPQPPTTSTAASASMPVFVFVICMIALSSSIASKISATLPAGGHPSGGRGSRYGGGAKGLPRGEWGNEEMGE